MSIINSYFSSLAKRCVLLYLICLFIFFLLIPLSYPIKSLFHLSIQLFLIALPWGLIFQQIYFCSIKFNNSYYSKFQELIFSSLLASLIVIIIFPYTHYHHHIPIKEIRPYSIIKNKSIFSYTNGTLILNMKKEQKLFSLPNSKALWIDENNIIFQDIKTNNTLIELSSPLSFDEFGYHIQNGNLFIPLVKYPLLLPKIPLAESFYQLWLTTIYSLHYSLDQLFIDSHIIIQNKKNISLNIAKSLTKDFNHYLDTSLQNKTLPSNTNSIKSSVSSSTYNNIFNYLNIFISIWIIFLTTSLFSLLISIRQNILGKLALILLFIIFVIPYFPYIFRLIHFFHSQYPNFSIFSLKVISLIILIFINLIIINLRYFIQRRKYE